MRPDVDESLGLLGGRRGRLASGDGGHLLAARGGGGGDFGRHARRGAFGDSGGRRGGSGSGGRRGRGGGWRGGGGAGGVRRLADAGGGGALLVQGGAIGGRHALHVWSAFECHQSGPEMPPSLRIRQKWTAMRTAVINGMPITCRTYQRTSVLSLIS